MTVVVSTKFVTFWTFFIRRLTGQAADAVLARFPRASTYVLVELDEKATASSQKIRIVSGRCKSFIFHPTLVLALFFLSLPFG